MAEDNKENNTGCIIGIIIFVAINLIWFFATTSKEEIASTGAFIIGLAVFGLAVFLISKLGKRSGTTQTEELSWKGCLAGIGILLAAIISVVFATSSKDVNMVVGAIIAILIAVGIGIWLYNSSKD